MINSKKIELDVHTTLLSLGFKCDTSSDKFNIQSDIKGFYFGDYLVFVFWFGHTYIIDLEQKELPGSVYIKYISTPEHLNRIYIENGPVSTQHVKEKITTLIQGTDLVTLIREKKIDYLKNKIHEERVNSW